MKSIKMSLLVLICAVFIFGCNNVQYSNNPSDTLNIDDGNELLYGKYPEPILMAIGESYDVNKNYKELTKDDLKKVTKLYFDYNYDPEKEIIYPDEKYGFEYSKKYDFSILLEMPNITTLDIYLGENVKLEDYSVLKNLSKLEWLRVGNVNNYDVEVLAGITSLKQLYIYNSKDITSIEFLRDMQQLTYFELDNVPNVHDYQPLKYLINVESVLLESSGLTEKDVNTLPDMDSIEILSLHNNKIVSINSLPKMKNLRSLILTYNPLTEINISPDRIPNLKDLCLVNTKITDLNILSGVSSIESINLRNTGVKRISPLKEYKNLKSINVNLINIEDLDVFKDSTVDVYELEG